MPTKIDLSGKRFGRLEVQHEIQERIGGRIYWRVKCDCGKEKNVSGRLMVIGNTLSCGCLRNEICAYNFPSVMKKADELLHTGD